MKLNALAKAITLATVLSATSFGAMAADIPLSATVEADQVTLTSVKADKWIEDYARLDKPNDLILSTGIPDYDPTTFSVEFPHYAKRAAASPGRSTSTCLKARSGMCRKPLPRSCRPSYR